MLNSIVISAGFLHRNLDFLLDILDIFFFVWNILDSSNGRSWWQFSWNNLSDILISDKRLLWSISFNKLSLIALNYVWISDLKRDLLCNDSTTTWNQSLIDLIKLLAVLSDWYRLRVNDLEWRWLGSNVDLTKGIWSNYLSDNWLIGILSVNGISFSGAFIWIGYLCCHGWVGNNLIYIVQNKNCFDYYWID